MLRDKKTNKKAKLWARGGGQLNLFSLMHSGSSVLITQMAHQSLSSISK